MSFSSILRFFDHAYLLKHEFLGVASTFTTLKFMHLAYGKIRRAVRRALGQDVGLEDAWGAGAGAAALDAATLAKLPKVLDAAGHLVPDPRAVAAAQASGESMGVWGWIVPCLSLAILWTLLKFLWRRLFPTPPPNPEEEEAKLKAEQAANTPQPVMGPDGKPVIGPNGQPIMATPAQLLAQQGGGMGMGMGMGSPYGGMGGMGMGMGSSYGGMGGGYGSGGLYGGGMGMGGGYGSSYGGGYGSSYGGMGGMGGYGSSMGGYGSSYGAGGYGGSSMYGGGMGMGGY